MCPVNLQSTELVWLSRPEILAVWWFGSAHRRRMQKGSDIDLGILVQGKPSVDLLADLRAALQEVLQFEDIDIVVLNEASSFLRFEAINGQSLFCRDERRKAEFVSMTAREYEDEMAALKKIMQQTVT